MIEKLGKYEVVEKIGVGGFGTVYRGRDPFIKRTVAIKTCQSDDEEIKKRFFREAELCGNLHHRNITTIYDFGVENGVPFIVQEYLTGDDLDKIIKRGEFTPLERKIQILIEIADGLSYAHAAGIIHRDIKPSNIRILADGVVKIMDFGIAKSIAAESNLTQTGITLGTAAYLAPEQIRGEAIDPRTDIFSLGVLGYELLSHQKPFRGEHISTVLFKILNEKPEPISRPGVDVPPALERAIDRAIEKDPVKRYSSCGAFRQDLTAVLRDMRGGHDTSAGLARPRTASEDAPTRVNMPMPVPAPVFSAAAGITPPSGALARSSSPQPEPDPTPTPTPSDSHRSASLPLEFVDFRNPTGLETRPTADRAPNFLSAPRRSYAGLVTALILLILAAGGGAYYYFGNRPQSEAGTSEKTTTGSIPPPPSALAPPVVTSATASPPATSEAASPASTGSATAPGTAAERKEEAPRPVRKFSLSFTSMPMATLWIDGKQVGDTVPKKVLRLDEGKHVLRMEMEDGESFEQSFRAGNGEKTSFVHRFPVGSLLITAGPAWTGANVLVDGKGRGRLPLHGYILVSPGAHEIAASKEGVPPFLKTIRIEENRRQELAIPAPEKLQ